MYIIFMYLYHVNMLSDIVNYIIYIIDIDQVCINIIQFCHIVYSPIILTIYMI